MDALATLLVQQACIEVGNAWARALDFNDQDHFVELFTDDALLDYDGVHEGLPAIAEWIGNRPRGVRTRHVLSNSWIDVRDADRARGISYLTLWRTDHADLRPEAVASTPGPAAVGHCEDRFLRQADGWRLQARCVRWSMRRGDADTIEPSEDRR